MDSVFGWLYVAGARRPDYEGFTVANIFCFFQTYKGIYGALRINADLRHIALITLLGAGLKQFLYL